LKEVKSPFFIGEMSVRIDEGAGDNLKGEKWRVEQVFLITLHP
jgi:hypothetical protein